MTSMTSSEVGRELKAAELQRETVVVLHVEGRPHVTAWCAGATRHIVFFYMGITKITLALHIRPDGYLEDDASRKVEVYEFLGEA